MMRLSSQLAITWICTCAIATLWACAGTPQYLGYSGSADAGPDAEADGGCDFLGCTDSSSATATWPKNHWIAFDSDRADFNRDIYVMRPDGTSVQRLTTEPSVERQPAFSHDGKQLAFASDRIDYLSQIFIMDLQTKAVTQLTRNPKGADAPSWSPDGKLLAFHSDSRIYTIRIDGTNETLRFGPEFVDGGWGVGEGGVLVDPPYDYPSFSPDGAWLVANGSTNIVAVKLDQSEIREVVPSLPNTQEMPSLSPGGYQVAFCTFCEPLIESVWVVPMGGLPRGINPCTAGARVSPAGAPSSRRPNWGPLGFIAYEQGAGRSSIMVVPESGGTPVNITGDASDNRNPAWSPAQGAVIVQ